MQGAKNGKDNRAGMRGYVQFNSFTYKRTHTHTHPVASDQMLS